MIETLKQAADRLMNGMITHSEFARDVAHAVYVGGGTEDELVWLANTLLQRPTPTVAANPPAAA